MRYPINEDVAIVYGQQLKSCHSYYSATRIPKSKENLIVWIVEKAPCIDLEKEDLSVKLTEETNIGGGVIKLGANLYPELKRDIC